MRLFLQSLILLLCALLLASCGAPTAEAPAAPPPIEVDTLPVQAAAYQAQAHLVGRTRASRSAEVRSRVSGILLSREYREGSDVAAGALLFKIDPSSLQAARGEAAARLQRSRAERDNAEAVARRVADLVRRGLASAQAGDDAAAALRVAIAAQGEAEAALQRAELELGWSAVRAPISGRAGRAEVSEGALVADDGGTLLTLIEQIDPLYLETTVPAREWPLLRAVIAAGGEPSVRVLDPDGTLLAEAAKVEFTDLAADPATGVVQVRASLPNADARLLPGMFVRIEAALPLQPAAILIPASAVLRDARGSYVFVLGEGGTAERRELRLGEQDGARWQVLEGLSGGETLIVSALQRVRPGAAVKPAAPAQAAP